MNIEFDDLSNLSKDSYIFWLPQNIKDKDSLMLAYFYGVDFPDYFGENWNAFWDCLCDFHWRDKTTVVIHQNLPNLPEKDLFTYLEIIDDACASWLEEEYPKFKVFFVNELKDKVTEILGRIRMAKSQ